jgi:TfoX/Sxy family transcriptional regulator of competence genes
MSYDHGLVERVRDALARLGERSAREKNVFGGRGFLFGKKTFLVVMDDGLLVKTARTEHQALLRLAGVEAFTPDGGRPMSTWVVVSNDPIADDPELTEWVARGIRGIRDA